MPESCEQGNIPEALGTYVIKQLHRSRSSTGDIAQRQHMSIFITNHITAFLRNQRFSDMQQYDRHPVSQRILQLVAYGLQHIRI
ncbi:hypothetical protein D3C71_2028000 [compost metagenome]